MRTMETERVNGSMREGPFNDTVNPVKTCMISAISMMVCLLMIATTAAKAQSFTVPAGERQLFLDDVPIAEMDGLTRSMHQAVKKGAVIRPDYLGQERHFTVRNVPNWDREREVFRFLVTEAAGPNISTVWESDDGLHWVRAGTSDMVTYTVVYDPTDPDPSRRYKSMNRTRIAVSPDMLTWEVVGNPKITGSDEHNLSFDEKSHVFFFSVKRGGPYGRYGRSHALYTSEDLAQWSKVPIAGEDSLFHADDEDQEHNREAITALMEELVADPRLAQTDFYAEGNYNVDIYNTPVFRYESHYLALPAIHPSITMDLSDPSDNIALKIPQLWWSRDLENWSRPEDREEFITLSRTESGAYDLAVAFPPSSPVIRGDELWFYYAGDDGLGWPPKTGLDLTREDWKYYRPDRSAICLAVLRRDGFMSLDAGAGGSVLTREFTVPGPELFVNLDATDGQLVVEVIDESAVVARSGPLSGDQTNAAVAWQDGNIADHEGAAVRLRFALHDASLYSFWFGLPEE